MGIKKGFKRFKEGKFFNGLMKVAPLAARLVGGPVGGLVVQVANEILGTDYTSEKQLAAAAEKDPTIILKMRGLDVRLEEIAAQHEIDLEELAGEDRASAREMHVELKSKTPLVLALYILSLFSVIVGTILYGMITQTIVFDDVTEKFIYFLLGAVVGWVTLVFQFHFGSSRSSLIKTIEQTEALRGYMGKT